MNLLQINRIAYQNKDIMNSWNRISVRARNIVEPPVIQEKIMSHSTPEAGRPEKLSPQQLKNLIVPHRLCTDDARNRRWQRALHVAVRTQAEVCLGILCFRTETEQWTRTQLHRETKPDAPLRGHRSTSQCAGTVLIISSYSPLKQPPPPPLGMLIASLRRACQESTLFRKLLQALSSIFLRWRFHRRRELGRWRRRGGLRFLQRREIAQGARMTLAEHECQIHPRSHFLFFVHAGISVA